MTDAARAGGLHALEERLKVKIGRDIGESDERMDACLRLRVHHAAQRRSFERVNAFVQPAHELIAKGPHELLDPIAAALRVHGVPAVCDGSRIIVPPGIMCHVRVTSGSTLARSSSPQPAGRTTSNWTWPC